MQERQEQQPITFIIRSLLEPRGSKEEEILYAPPSKRELQRAEEVRNAILEEVRQITIGSTAPPKREKFTLPEPVRIFLQEP